MSENFFILQWQIKCYIIMEEYTICSIVASKLFIYIERDLSYEQNYNHKFF